MKKNVMMRVASALLVAVLMTTCAISGTFAKYTTGADADDTARVAKWGVTATVTGEAFAKEYAADDQNTELTVTVSSSTEDKLVAPGTEGTFTGVALTGTPEVAVQIEKTATITVSGWMIDDDKNDQTADVFYCPLVFVINGNTITGSTYSSAADLQTAIKNAIEAANDEYAPKTNLANITGMNGDYTWSWDFDDNGAGTNDAKDTILGDMVANGGTATITIDVEVEVTQID